jgi:hypothetical protein
MWPATRGLKNTLCLRRGAICGFEPLIQLKITPLPVEYSFLQAGHARTMPITSSINPPFELLLLGSFGIVSPIPVLTKWGTARLNIALDVGGRALRSSRRAFILAADSWINRLPKAEPARSQENL